MSKSPRTIWYVTSLKIPTIWAHGVQMMKMCEAFAGAGAGVRLFAQRSSVLPEDPFLFYAVAHHFDITYVDRAQSVFEKIPTPYILWFMNIIGFGRAFMGSAKAEQALPDIVYCREYLLLFFLKKFGKPIFFEAHTPPGFFARQILKKVLPLIAGIGVTTSYVKEELVRIGVPAQKIMVVPDGFSEDDFSAPKKLKDDLRRELGIALDKKIIMYVGHLFLWKGVYTLAESTRFIGNKIPYEIVCIGGHEPDREAFLRFINANELKHIRVIPRQEYRRIISFLAAADIFVLPNSAREPISRLYTSPIKLFEYMASARPIVASDLPSIRQILNEKTAVMVQPDDPKDLGRGIRVLLKHPSQGAALAQAALIQSKEYTWAKRAQNIIEYLQKTI